MHPQQKHTAAQTETSKPKPGLAAFYDLRPGNGMGLLSKK